MQDDATAAATRSSDEPNAGESVAPAAAQAEDAKPSRKKDPAYHVWSIPDAAHPERMVLLTRPGEPQHADSREDAISIVAEPPDVSATGQSQAEEEAFMVVLADQVKIIKRRVKAQTEIVQTFS